MSGKWFEFQISVFGLRTLGLTIKTCSCKKYQLYFSQLLQESYIHLHYSVHFEQHFKMKSEKNSNMKIRSYDKSDHDRACKLFYDGMVENWFRLYKRSLNFKKAPKTTMIQVILLFLVYHYAPSFTLFLILQLFFQSVIALCSFLPYWIYARYALKII